METEKKSYQTVNRIPKILDILSRHPDGLPMKSIIELLDNPPRSSIFVILQQLVNVRYLTFSETEKKYKIGPALIKLSAVIMEGHTIQKRVRPYLEKLSQLTGEDSYLGILDGDRIRYLDRVEGSQSIRVNISIGSAALLHSSAIGKLLFAHLNTKEQKRILDNNRFRGITKNTITDKSQIILELNNIKMMGYSVSKEESMEGIYGIAAPIKNSQNEVIAGICIAPPKRRAVKNIDSLIQVVVEIANEIHNDLNS